MIELAGITLDPDLFLVGVESNRKVSYSVRELLGGTAVIQTHTRDVGARLSLSAKYDGSSKQGEFLQKEIEALQIISNAGAAVAFTHPRFSSPINVFILEFNVTQNEENEPPGDCKKFHGEIILQEA